MARLFDGTAGSALTLASAFGLTSYPKMIAFWFARSGTGSSGVLACVTSAGNSDAHYAEMNASNFRVSSNDWGIASANREEATNTTNWVHGVADWSASNSRRGYVNGVNATGNDTTDITVTGQNELNIARYNAGVAQGAAAKICAAAGWTVTLTQGEITSLSKGFPPRRIRPQSLAFYIPMVRDLQELRTGQAFATSGGTVADHPRMYGF